MKDELIKRASNIEPGTGFTKGMSREEIRDKTLIAKYKARYTTTVAELALLEQNHEELKQAYKEHRDALDDLHDACTAQLEGHQVVTEKLLDEVDKVMNKWYHVRTVRKVEEN